MNPTAHLGFLHMHSQIQGLVYVPRYYNIELTNRLRELTATHELIVLGDLMRQGNISVATGDEIGKMAYGTGSIPFVRTSDISNWEIKTDPKQGVSLEIYEQYASKQDVRPGDLLFVRDGTYLIGSTCLLTDADARILYQSHILKLRVASTSQVTAPLLLALLSTPIVRKQIRAKQFTADIIDTIGNRYQELVLPVPRSQGERLSVHDEAQDIIQQRVLLRERLRRIPLWAEGIISDLTEDPPIATEDASELGGNVGFLTSSHALKSGIYVPRYYNPALEHDLRSLAASHMLISLGELVERGILSFATGIEPGKMAYGTGPVPFIRTSDITNWEIKADPKQSIGEELYEQTKSKLDVRAGDIFVVRDGTYLVGASAIITPHDARLVYAGGLYKIHVRSPRMLDPYLLLALLNTPIVRRQMRAKQFTRDIIDTLGKRIYEVFIPIPKDSATCERIAEVTRETVEARGLLRNRSRQLTLELEGGSQAEEEESELKMIGSI